MRSPREDLERALRRNPDFCDDLIRASRRGEVIDWSPFANRRVVQELLMKRGYVPRSLDGRKWDAETIESMGMRHFASLFLPGTADAE